MPAAPLPPFARHLKKVGLVSESVIHRVVAGLALVGLLAVPKQSRAQGCEIHRSEKRCMVTPLSCPYKTSAEQPFR